MTRVRQVTNQGTWYSFLSLQASNCDAFVHSLLHEEVIFFGKGHRYVIFNLEAGSKQSLQTYSSCILISFVEARR